jgi:DNA-binding IclR family transcriptional regulator
MHALAQKLRQSCHLGIIDGGHVVIIAPVDSPEPTGFYVKMGSKVELMHAATGHVILAHQTEDARARALEEWRFETKRRNPPTDFEKHLAKIRTRGYERRASYQVAGVLNVSFPILNVLGQAIAGLTVPYVKRLEDTILIDHVVDETRETSRKISEAMGAKPAE